MTHMLPKPRKGSATAMRRARTRLAHAREQAAKGAAKARDGWTCRRCDKLLQAPKRSMGDIPAWLEVGSGEAAEAAHIADKGMGGDPTGLRSWKASDYVTLCHDCHQGPRSVHSGHVVIVAGRKGGDGRVKFVDGTPGETATHSRRKRRMRGAASLVCVKNTTLTHAGDTFTVDKERAGRGSQPRAGSVGALLAGRSDDKVILAHPRHGSRQAVKRRPAARASPKRGAETHHQAKDRGAANFAAGPNRGRR